MKYLAIIIILGSLVLLANMLLPFRYMQQVTKEGERMVRANNDAEWHHIVIVNPLTEHKVYFDGALVSERKLKPWAQHLLSWLPPATATVWAQRTDH